MLLHDIHVFSSTHFFLFSDQTSPFSMYDKNNIP